MQHATTDAERHITRRGRYGWLLRRFAAASAVATVSNQLVFVTAYAAGASPVVATVLAWLAGAVPNFLLNRRAWGGGGRRALRGEILRFVLISVSTALLAAVATSSVEPLALRWFSESPSARIALVSAVFLGTYAVMFVLKFVLMDRIVFTARRRREPVR
ncbi:GtrA-like protein [Halopolyspora algeriensis]|uniref:GtrA-like protein n=1 Tax=Halopolyspora algeriensis TaxID=1500506 RepID=A0A368VT65_9ACTN|nr:GtrA family protein [Halopolyspora algeriensis]RCW43176.1 GtrA-like protein [Halopolyspora algeriensis]TQM56234.1 putative flippase GtrA [Halopolyspora algeriensis]